MRKIITLVLILCSLGFASVTFGDEEEPFIRKLGCDADVVVEHMGMRQTKWLEVIDSLEAMGTMDTNWANEYRQLINEAYAFETDEQLQVWLQEKCKAYRK